MMHRPTLGVCTCFLRVLCPVVFWCWCRARRLPCRLVEPGQEDFRSDQARPSPTAKAGPAPRGHFFLEARGCGVDCSARAARGLCQERGRGPWTIFRVHFPSVLKSCSEYQQKEKAPCAECQPEPRLPGILGIKASVTAGTGSRALSLQQQTEDALSVTARVHSGTVVIITYFFIV